MALSTNHKPCRAIVPSQMNMYKSNQTKLSSPGAVFHLTGGAARSRPSDGCLNYTAHVP